VTVTATAGGSTAPGILLRVKVLTGAASAQTGATGINSSNTPFTPDLSLSTTTTGSYVYGALVNGAPLTNGSAFTPASGNTLLDSYADSANAEQYGATRTTAATGTPGPVTAGASAPLSTGSIAFAEILPGAGGISEDPSSPATAVSTTGTAVSTASFTPPDGALLVAMVASDGGSGQTTMSVSGGGVAWTPMAEANTAPSDYAGVWVARLPSSDPHDPVITAAQGGSTAAGLAMRIFVLTQAAATQDGGTQNASISSSTAFTGSITTTQTGSRVYGAVSHTNVSDVAAANSTLLDDVADATNNGRYVTFKATTLTGTPGATTLGVTAASSTTGPLAQAEVKTSGTLTEDGSAPAPVSTTSATFVSCANFTPPAGSLLVVLVASDGGTGITTMSVSGGGLNFTELVKNNPSGLDYAGVWVAQVPAGGGIGPLPSRPPRKYRRIQQPMPAGTPAAAISAVPAWTGARQLARRFVRSRVSAGTPAATPAVPLRVITSRRPFTRTGRSWIAAGKVPVPISQSAGSAAAANNATASFTSRGGTTLVAMVGRSGGLATGALTGVIDSAGNSWGLVTRGAVSGQSNTRLECWAAFNAAAVTSVTFQSGTSQTYVWNISEWPGSYIAVDAASPDNSGAGPGTTIDTPSITPSGRADVFLAAAHYNAVTSGTLNTANWAPLLNFDDAAGSGRAAFVIPNSTAPESAEWLLGSSASAGVVTVALGPSIRTPPAATRTARRPYGRTRPAGIAPGIVVTAAAAPVPPAPSRTATRLRQAFRGQRSAIQPGIVVTITPPPVVPARVRTLRVPFTRPRPGGIRQGVVIAAAPVTPVVPGRIRTPRRPFTRIKSGQITAGIVVTVTAVIAPVVPDRIRTVRRPFTRVRPGLITTGLVVTVTAAPVPVVPVPVKTLRRPFTRVKSAGIRPGVIVKIPVAPASIRTPRQPFTRVKTRGITPGRVVVIIIPPIVPARVRTRFRPHTKAISRSKITGVLDPGAVIVVFYATSVAGGTERNRTDSGTGTSPGSAPGTGHLADDAIGGAGKPDSTAGGRQIG